MVFSATPSCSSGKPEAALHDAPRFHAAHPVVLFADGQHQRSVRLNGEFTGFEIIRVGIDIMPGSCK